MIDGATVDLFAAVAHAERYFEPPDVADLLMFDADGLCLTADVVEDDVPVLFSLTTKRPRVAVDEEPGENTEAPKFVSIEASPNILTPPKNNLRP